MRRYTLRPGRTYEQEQIDKREGPRNRERLTAREWEQPRRPMAVRLRKPSNPLPK